VTGFDTFVFAVGLLLESIFNLAHMKALVLSEKGSPPRWQEVPDPRAGAGEAIIRVHVAALNHRDVWIQKGQYAGLKYPIIPGSDGSGIVVEVGPEAGANGGGVGGAAGGGGAADRKNWMDKEVIINPSIGWGDHQGYQDPVGFRILGLPDDGTMAEYVRVPVANLVEKPAHLSFTEAATLPLAGVTAFRALMARAGVASGESVLITGIGGGVALFALQFAVTAGAKVYVSSGSDDKLARAKELGALGGANYKEKGWVETLRALGGGFDVVIDGAAGDNLNDLLDLAAPGGRIVVYGATRGNPSGVVARRIFWKQLNLLGTTMGSPDDFAAMVAFVAQHRIVPVIDKVYDPRDGETAFRRMDDGEQFGKIAISIR
jgi:zinc-binding alcohol dehydrogenase/oxidoreductase